MAAGLLILAGLAALIYAFISYVNKKYKYFEERGVKFVKPYYLMGNMYDFLIKKSTIQELGQNMYNKFPKER